jgi:hypothetical protein
MQPEDFQDSLTRSHYVSAIEGTNNLLFYLASTAEIGDKKIKFPPAVITSLGLPPDIKTMFDYRSRYPGIYNRLHQFCVISLCADIETFFKALFFERSYTPGKGRGFFQRFDDVISKLTSIGFDFTALSSELRHLKRAFLIRHICIHNLGRVDQEFADTTKLPVTVGDLYALTQEEYRSMFDAYEILLKHIDTTLASVNSP